MNIDAFGVTQGSLKEKYHLMYEQDLFNYKYMLKELEKIKYKKWKQDNVARLWMEWEKKDGKEDQFENYCKRVYDMLKK